MDWLEGCEVFGDFNRLYIYGFHGNKFVVWSRYSGMIAILLEKKEIIKLICNATFLITQAIF